MDILAKLKVFSLVMLLLFLAVTISQFLGKDLKSIEKTKAVIAGKVDVLLARNTKLPQDMEYATGNYSRHASTEIAGEGAATIYTEASLPREMQMYAPDYMNNNVKTQYIQTQIPHVNTAAQNRKTTAAERQEFPASYTEDERKSQLNELSKSNNTPVVQVAPQGFRTTRVGVFTLFTQAPKVSQDFINRLSFLGDVLGQKLWIFSPWIKESTIYIYLFSDYKTYTKHTGRPGWSGGSSSLSKRSVYVIDGDDTFPIMAHELTHIYFDTFFIGGTTSPMWISEGMATYFQVKAGRGAPPWLAGSIKKLQGGYYFPMEEFLMFDKLKALSADEIELWYSQTYAFVDFLMNIAPETTFYALCKSLREGVRPAAALYRTYGSDFSSASDIERLWLNYLRRANYSNLTVLDSSKGTAGGIGLADPVEQKQEASSASPRRRQQSQQQPRQSIINFGEY